MNAAKIPSHSRLDSSPLATLHVRQLFETLSGMIKISSADGQLEYVDQGILELVGVPFEELAGTQWFNVLHPDDAAGALKEWVRCSAAKLPFEYFCRVRTRDGAYRWCQWQLKPLLDECSEVVKFYGYLADTDAMRRADDSLHEDERALRFLVDSVPALVWRFDADGTIEFLNQRAARYSGLAPGDPPSKFRARIHADDMTMTARAWDLARAKDEPFSTTYRLLGPTGSYRWFEVRSEPIHDRDGRAEHWYGFAVDVDERVRMSEQLRANQAALERASRMATVAELSASIAHEISQPLAAIANNGAACSRWLATEPPNMPRARLAMERIVRDALSASNVVSGVRALYRYGPLFRAEVELNLIVREVHELVRSECARARVRIEMDLASKLPLVTADRVQLQQVLINLVRNAVDAMRAAAQQNCSIVLRSRLVANDGEACIEVTDTGPGFADDQRAFEAFYTTKEHGMGMGLAICRSIAEAHGGRIVARNLQPHGASLELFLPIISDRASNEERSALGALPTQDELSRST